MKWYFFQLNPLKKNVNLKSKVSFQVNVFDYINSSETKYFFMPSRTLKLGVKPKLFSLEISATDSLISPSLSASCSSGSLNPNVLSIISINPFNVVAIPVPTLNCLPKDSYFFATSNNAWTTSSMNTKSRDCEPSPNNMNCVSSPF